MTLTTKSKHQGYVEFPENGSWSWFEVGILSKDKGYGSEAERIRTKQSEDGETLLTFKSHENKVHDRGYVQYTNHFGAHHPIWEELREGDSLGIFGCVRQPGWACRGREAVLELYYFDGDCVV